ncbi:MAG: protein TonB [Candidatus Krumholzibacteriia bacterium]|jgi:protein TonB
MNNWRPKIWLIPACALAVLLNFALLASAARLSSDRLHSADITDPVGVSLVTLKPTAPPPAPEKKEIPKPKPKPRPEFMPELSRPSFDAPDEVTIDLQIDESLFDAEGPRGEFIFNATDLDAPPRVVVRTEPAYPYRAQQRNINGEVEVMFLVGVDGRVSQAQIMSSNPPGLFDEAVLKAVVQWKFRPGSLDGKLVPSWVITPVVFNLESK